MPGPRDTPRLILIVLPDATRVAWPAHTPHTGTLDKICGTNYSPSALYAATPTVIHRDDELSALG